MTMFDNNDQSGTVGFLIGIIVLVFAGIFLSLMVDKRLGFSSSRVSLEKTVAEEARHLESVRHRLEVAREQWRKEAHPRAGQESDLTASDVGVRSSAARLAALRERRVAAAAELSAAGEAFAAHRSRYRLQVRADAVGEKIPELKTRDGRTYADATIRRVTPAGIEITHAAGVSGLLPDDLDAAWRDRFQWHPEEAEMALKQEKAREEELRKKAGKSRAPKEVPVPAGPVLSEEKQAEQEAEKKLAGLRREVTEARRHLKRAESEAARARAEAQGSRDRSVPGGLETREEKAARMEATVSKFRARYVDARARLATDSPDDALLRETPQ